MKKMVQIHRKGQLGAKSKLIRMRTVQGVPGTVQGVPGTVAAIRPSKKFMLS
jgi:hypothetical protein